MASEAETIYTALIEQHGMPPGTSLLKMGSDWYLVPDDVDANDPDAAVSTAVFRMLPPDQLARAMCIVANKWCATFIKPEDEPEPAADGHIARLQQVLKLAAARNS